MLVFRSVFLKKSLGQYLRQASKHRIHSSSPIHFYSQNVSKDTLHLVFAASGTLRNIHPQIHHGPFLFTHTSTLCQEHFYDCDIIRHGEAYGKYFKSAP